MPRLVKKLSFFSLALLAELLSVPLLFAAPTAEEVSKELIKAFSNPTGGKKQKAPITEKNHLGVHVRTVTFAIGKKTYRIVFSGDGNVSIALMQEGDLAAQPLWTTSVNHVKVEEIVNFIYSREVGKPYDPYAQPKTEAQIAADLEKERMKKKKEMDKNFDGSALRWNQLMNRVLQGDFTGLGGGKSQPEMGLARAFSIAKSMDPCGQSRGGLSPQRAAVADVAQAIAASSAEPLAKGEDDLYADRSREYEKKKTTSILTELNEHHESPEDAFRLIQDSGSNTTELFRSALSESDQNSKDPYALASTRNFKTLIRSVGEKKAIAIVQSVLKRVVVDVTAFTELRKLLPKSSVIYDRIADHYFVDPTLNSPSEARYLLSLATWYELELRNSEVVAWLNQYKEAEKKISALEHATLDQNDERTLVQQRTNLALLSKKLDEFARKLHQTPAYPR